MENRIATVAEENGRQEGRDLSIRKGLEALQKLEQLKGSHYADKESVNVSRALLDDMLALMNELSRTRTQLTRLSYNHQIDKSELQVEIRQLNQLSGRLREAVVKTRMQPFTQLSARWPKLVRDLAAAQDKYLTFSLVPSNLTLDMAWLPILQEPLRELLRQIVTGEIESPQQRKQNGKREEAKLTIKVEGKGAFITIHIRHDGQAADKAGKEAIQALSTTLQAHGGILQAEEAGNYVLRLPRNLSLVPVVVVGAGAQRFAISHTGIREILSLVPGLKTQSVPEMITHEEAQFLRHQGKTYPLIRLADTLGITAQEPTVAILCGTGDSIFALAATTLHQTEEVAPKPLPRLLQQMPAYRNCALLADGTVALILNTASLLKPQEAQAVKTTAAPKPAATIVKQVRKQEVVKETVRALSRQKHILLVDDSPFFRKFMTPVLTIEDFEVTAVSSAEEAISLLDATPERFDLVLTDLDMPGMDGVQFVQHCKQQSSLRGLPFVALLSNTPKGTLEESANPGFSGVVAKSERDALISIIHSSLRSAA